LSYSSPVWSG